MRIFNAISRFVPCKIKKIRIYQVVLIETMAAITIMAIISSRFLPMFKNGVNQSEKISQSGQKFSLATKGDKVSPELVPESIKAAVTKESGKNGLIFRVKVDEVTDDDKRGIKFHLVDDGQAVVEDWKKASWAYYVL